jgi:hypothetical protein
MADEEPTIPIAGASQTVGKLMVLLHDQGLLDDGDIETILRRALTGVAPARAVPAASD